MAFSSFLQANGELEKVLLAEFQGDRDLNSADRMLDYIEQARLKAQSAAALLERAVELGSENPTPYRSAFRSLNVRQLSDMWSQGLLVDSDQDVREIGFKLQADNLEPMRGFVRDLKEIASLTSEVAGVFRTARSYALEGDIVPAIERNAFPLQALYARALSRWLRFIKRYHIESLIATEVLFSEEGVGSIAV